MQTKNITFQNGSGSFVLSTHKAEGHYDMPNSHFHDMYEVYYLLAGERCYFIKDRTYGILKGDLVFIGPYDLHKTTDTGVPDHERVLIKFKEDFVTTINSPLRKVLSILFKEGNNLLRLALHEQNMIEDLLYKMIAEAQNKNTGFEAVLQALLIQFLVYATRYTEQSLTDSFEHPSPIHEKISEIVHYINQHYSDALSLSLVSERFFISPYYLSRVFKEVTGFTFIEYLNSVRIKEAQKLLRESKMKVITLAEKVGYGNIAHFGRVFKKVAGLSPLQYRKTRKF